MNDASNNDRLSSAFSVANRTELETHYAGWADTYDAENAAMGFRLPILAAGMLARYVPVDERPILDAGCGTGLAGDNLWILGYRNLVGIDLSEPMLVHARKLEIYNHLAQMVLGEPLDFPSNMFGATIVTGVFTEGHAPYSSFDELIRITKTGGFIVFNVRDDIYEDHGFRTKMERLEADGEWRLAEMSEKFRPFSISEAHVIARLFAYEVL